MARTGRPDSTRASRRNNIFDATNKIGEVTGAAPYFVLTTNLTPGIYYYAARATDNQGATGVSTIVSNTVWTSR